jgi:tRNA-modifying protein YgfZ
MSQIFADPSRSVLQFEGADVRPFLQSLLTNSVDKVTPTTCVYASLLTPQGKYLADFFLYQADEVIFADVPEARAQSLLSRLMMYKLRRDVQIVLEQDLMVFVSDTKPDADTVCDAPDPRHEALGWRGVMQTADVPKHDLTQRYIELGIPQDGIDLLPEESYILEMGFERLNGVDFRKGCYVGQEVVARMHHKTTLKKGLVQLAFDEPLSGDDLDVMADGKRVGRVGTRTDTHALALMKLDALDKMLSVGGVAIKNDKIF